MLLKPVLFYPAGCTPASSFAALALEKAGIPLTDHPSPDITHLLLDVPSFDSRGNLRSGEDPARMLAMLPPDITVVGGNLVPFLPEEYARLDLLQSEDYVAKNAAFTADCALRIAALHLKKVFVDSRALVIGWGRIGKCLSLMLQSLSCQVTVAARKESDRAMAAALGFSAVPIAAIPQQLGACDLLFNTVPAPVVTKDTLSANSGCIPIELASKPGLEGKNVIQAKGLPGIHVPSSSGQLIADTILAMLKEASQ